MPFSKYGKALIKNVYQFKEYGSRRILAEFSKTSYEREVLDILLKRFGEQEARTKGTRTANRKRV